MTDRPVLDWLHAEFHGNLYFHERTKCYGTKDLWRWQVQAANDVHAVLRALIPYLRVKRALAEKVVAEIEEAG